jgi:hypothetical protein
MKWCVNDLNSYKLQHGKMTLGEIVYFHISMKWGWRPFGTVREFQLEDSLVIAKEKLDNYWKIAC